MSTEELLRVAQDGANVESKPDSERHELNEEVCDRLHQKWTSPDGTDSYTPPDLR